MPCLGFSGKNFKKLLSNLKSALSNLSTCKISRKKQMSKFGPKNALLWYFWARIWKNYCHIWNQLIWIILITKFRKRTSIPKFQTKKWLTFGLQFKKAIVISEISNLESLKNESLTQAVNFGIGSAFSQGPGSAFSKGPCPVLGPLYKVCQKTAWLEVFFKVYNVVTWLRNNCNAHIVKYFTK